MLLLKLNLCSFFDWFFSRFNSLRLRRWCLFLVLKKSEILNFSELFFQLFEVHPRCFYSHTHLLLKFLLLLPLFGFTFLLLFSCFLLLQEILICLSEFFREVREDLEEFLWWDIISIQTVGLDQLFDLLSQFFKLCLCILYFCSKFFLKSAEFP